MHDYVDKQTAIASNMSDQEVNMCFTNYSLQSGEHGMVIEKQAEFGSLLRTTTGKYTISFLFSIFNFHMLLSIHLLQETDQRHNLAPC